MSSLDRAVTLLRSFAHQGGDGMRLSGLVEIPGIAGPLRIGCWPV